MKKFQLLFAFLPVPLDFLMVWSAFLLSYWLRTQNILAAPPATYMMPWLEYIQLTGLISLGWVVVFALAGLYDLQSQAGFIRTFRRIFIAVSVSLAVFIIILFGIKESFFSRLIAAYAWILAIILMLIIRRLIVACQWCLAKFGRIRDNIIIIGTNSTAEELKIFYQHKLANVKLIDVVALQEASALEALIDKDYTDQVIVAGDLLNSNGLELDLINFCEINGIRFRYVPSLTKLHSLHVISEILQGHPIIELRSTPLDGWGRIVKRIFDFVSATILLVLLSPVMIIIAILVRRDSAGSALFVQRRPGQFSKEFSLYKFRTMYTHLSTGEKYGGDKAVALREELKHTKNEAAGLLFKMKDDPRVTKMGRWLRRTSLDELPQLFNVLNGEMSLVGPRPPLTDEVAEYSKSQFRRLMVRPGITGLWQVSGRSDSSFEEYLKLDMYYIEHWSIWLDIQIILKTVWVVLKRKGAY